jgi:pyrroline-5-carboxylate reductase
MTDCVGFLGVGHLADYTLRGLRRGGFGGEVLLSPRNAERSAVLARDCGGHVMESNQAVADGCDLVILSVRPANAAEALQGVTFRDSHCLVSVCPGIPVAELAPLASPARVVRAMPVTSAEAASSPTLVYPPDEKVAALFDHTGMAIPVPTEEVYEAAAANACAYGWYFPLFEHLIAETMAAGVPEEVARPLVLGMAKGAADVALLKPEESLEETTWSIAYEGTFTRLGLEHLIAKKAFDPYREALRKVIAGLRGGKV